MSTETQSEDRVLFQAVMPYADSARLQELYDSINQVLIEWEKSYLSANIRYCVHELFGNAEQSNAVMVYEVAKSDGAAAKELATVGSFEDYFHECRDLARAHAERFGAFISATASVENNAIVLRVMNNRQMPAETLTRIEYLLIETYNQRDFKTAMRLVPPNADPLIASLVSTSMMLKNMGCGPEALRLMAGEQDYMVAQLTLSPARLTNSFLKQMTNQILTHVESIPPLPDNVISLQKELGSSEWDAGRVVKLIKRDPAMSAALMKTVNSGMYMLPTKVADFKHAVALIGAKGLRTLLASFGAQNVLERRYGNMEELWCHAYRCGAYSQVLGFRAGLNDLLDDLFLTGVLHDIGKLVLFEADAGFESRLQTYCGRQKLDPTEVEKLALGIGHAMVGAQLASKWNFAKSVIAGIAFHHHPLKAAREYRKHVFPVYVANLLLDMEESGSMDYPECPPEVAEFFGVDPEDALPDLHDDVRRVVASGALN